MAVVAVAVGGVGVVVVDHVALHLEVEGRDVEVDEQACVGPGTALNEQACVGAGTIRD